MTPIHNYWSFLQQSIPPAGPLYSCCQCPRCIAQSLIVSFNLLHRNCSPFPVQSFCAFRVISSNPRRRPARMGFLQFWMAIICYHLPPTLANQCNAMPWQQCISIFCANYTASPAIEARCFSIVSPPTAFSPHPESSVKLVVALA